MYCTTIALRKLEAWTYSEDRAASAGPDRLRVPFSCTL
jgi:hypothetical protein